MIVSMFVEHHYSTSSEVERKLQKLAVIYLKTYFIQDLLVVIPFSYFFGSWINDQTSRLLYLIKVLRLHKAFWLLDHKTITR